ncbi:MAG: homocysteine S-methyltransferase family protein [Phycisphaeraceae bacterium]|nr:homocysteine S-methyltransferase family protein [Phycisphaeraceae bacterium]
MNQRFQDRLDAGILFCDGGMGTQLMAAGMNLGQCATLFNVERPEVVSDIHRRYAEAGCDLLTVNTFQGSATALAQHGLEGRVEELNEAGARLARQVADDLAKADRPAPLVLADIGPFGGFLEPLGETSRDELTRLFTQQLAAQQRGGADAVIIETMSDATEMDVALRTARALGDWTLIASFAFERGAGGGFHTMMGLDVEAAVQGALESGADVVGANCGSSLSLDDYVTLAERLVAAAGDHPVIIQPNAGTPVLIEDRSVHPATPEQMAALVPRLIDAGVRIIGGCCGTTPEHLRAMSTMKPAV